MSVHGDIHKVYLYINSLSVSFSPPELCGYRCREESLLPVSRPLRPKQPAGSSVQSHPLEKDGEFTIRIPHSSTLILYWSQCSNAIMLKYSITSKSPAFKILLKVSCRVDAQSCQWCHTVLVIKWWYDTKKHRNGPKKQGRRHAWK